MTLKRDFIIQLYSLIDSISDKHFNIETQYKFLKIKKMLKEEVEIYNQQLASLSSFCKTDENGNPITNSEGAVVIKEECKEECIKLVESINSFSITLPDIYFSLDELESLNLTLGQLELLEPFIK